jgi:O-succinylbenzoic acid--CoA ligase
MSTLVALAMPGGPAFVDALRRSWDDGDAIAPIDPRLPPTARRRVLDLLAPGLVVDAEGDRHRRRDGVPTEAGDAVVVTTSGTSGEPRGVVLTHAAVEASARATSARLAVDPDRDRWLACLPLGHIGGLSVVTRALITGTPVDVHPGFDAGAVTAASAAGATRVSLVATALGRIDPSGYRTVLLGGGPAPVSAPDNVVVTYGLTETGSGVVYDGVPLEGVEVESAADGSIRVRGPMLARAYRDGSDPTDDEGWLVTGDLGRWADGRLVVEGRRDDLIITGGENVWPEPVEDVLRRLPQVSDVAVTGRDDPEWGQRVVAHVVPCDAGAPPSLDELRTAVGETLSRWHAPRELVVRPSLPRTSSGKLRRADLR